MEQALLRHFEREHGHCLRARAVRGHMLRHVQGERGLAHRGPRGENDQLAPVEAAGHFVELQEAGGDALDTARRIEERVDAALELLDDAAGIGQRVLRARLAELEQRLFGIGQDLFRLVGAEEAAVDDLLRGEDQPPLHGVLLEDLDVALEVEQLREAVIERDEIAESADAFQLADLHQVVGKRDAVDFLAAFMQAGHPREDAPIGFEGEVVGLDGRGDGEKRLRLQQDRAQHEALGVQVRRQTFIEGNITRRHC